MSKRKEHVPIRAPQPCSEPGCDRDARRRGLCWMHYCRLRYWAIKNGEWEPQPSGNFGDPEGHRVSAKMGGDECAKDPAGLAEAGRRGHARLIERNPNAHHEIGIKAGTKLAENREHMREIGRRGIESRRRKKEQSG